MFNRLINYLTFKRFLSDVNNKLIRGAAGAAIRSIDASNPATWEFSGFSQNGEDGTINLLIGECGNRNNYFVEIGTSNGLENNSSWLALVKRYSWLMIEGNGEVNI